MKVCTKCKQEKDIESFSKRRGLELMFWCKLCVKSYDKARYTNGPTERLRAKGKQKKYREVNTRLILEYLKNHFCANCNENDPIVLEFDHQRDKKHNISQMISTFSWKSILEEIKKCQVLCANCHRRKTAKERGYLKYLYQSIA